MKKNRFQKDILFYVLVLALLICLIGLLQAVDVSKVDLYYYFALALAFATGATHVVALERLLNVYSFSKGLYVTVAIMGFAFGISAIICRYSSLNPEFLTFIFAFVIPYLCRHAYMHFWETIKSR